MSDFDNDQRLHWNIDKITNELGWRWIAWEKIRGSLKDLSLSLCSVEVSFFSS
jgi:hypothetical protein